MGWIGSAVLLVTLKRQPGFSFFSIVLGADYLSYVKSIVAHARTFLPLNISAVDSVHWLLGLT